MDKGLTTSKCYSSLDLKSGCAILHISGDELLELETNKSTIYKLDIKNQRRSILRQKKILNIKVILTSALS